MAITLPASGPTGPQTMQIIGGENLYGIAELYLNDWTQWYRIAALNSFPGEVPDFIISVADATRLGGTLQIPPVDTNATWP